MDRKTDKVKQENKPRDDGVELENQFIMRLPEEPAKVLQEALQTGNLKDRLSIKMDNDLRTSQVRFDQWLLHAKIVDLPTIIECHKTIDAKNFYKSADICQMMICKLEQDDVIDSEKESPNKSKKKDPNKVDKKYLWPHGITPPCKNVRKRRFRKTLKKKNVEAPEIEKEVKRLLRIDNDAVKVDYEIINEDIDKQLLDANSKEYNEDEFNEDVSINDGDGKATRHDSSSQKDINIETDDEDAPSCLAPTMHGGVGEHDIFGEEVSSSGDDDDERQDEARRSQESSRLSADDSRLSDFSMSVGASAGGGEVGNESRADESSFLQSAKDEPIEFNKSMFTNLSKFNPENDKSNSNFGDSNSYTPTTSGYFGESKLHTPSNFKGDSNSYTATTSGYFGEGKLHTPSNFKGDFRLSYEPPNLNAEEIKLKLTEIRRQYEDLKVQQTQKAQEISSIQNPTLKQRMQETLDTLLSQMVEKEHEIKDYENML